MEKRLFYFKRNSGVAVFEDGTAIDSVKNGRQFMQKLINSKMQKIVTWRLYLDVPEDFERIKSLFFTPDYWENRTWQEEAEC